MTAKKKNRRPACRALVEVYKRTPPQGVELPPHPPVKDYSVCGAGVHTVTLTFEDDADHTEVFQAAWNADTIELPEAISDVDDVFDEEMADFVKAWGRTKQLLYDQWGVSRWELQPGKRGIPRSMWPWIAGEVAKHRVRQYEDVPLPYANWASYDFHLDYQRYFNDRRKDLKKGLAGCSEPPDLTRLSWLRKQLDTGETPKEKGDALEILAEYVLGLIRGFDVRPKKLTSSGEHDRRIRNTSENKLLEQLGTYIILECKNWRKPIDQGEVNSLAEKLRTHHLTTGIIVSRRGVTGEDSAKRASAWRTIRTCFAQERLVVMSLKDCDLDELAAGKSMAQILVGAYERVLFA